MMRRLLVLVLVMALIVSVMTPVAHAGSSTDVALGLAAFAVFNQVVSPLLHPPRAHAGYLHRDYYHPPVVYTTRTIYAVPYSSVVVVPPPAPQPTVVQYPHGRYELRGDGVTLAYHWVWIPNPPPPPPAPPVPQSP